jgi:peptidoglycan hydrolase CwlO-like protein
MLPRFARPALAAALAVGVSLVGAGAGSAHDSIGSLRQGIASDGQREQQITVKLNTASQALALLERQLAVLNGRVAAVQGQLDADQARLNRFTVGVADEDARLVALRGRFERDKRALESWLVSAYENGQPDVMSVVFSAKGFSDLLEKLDFLKRTAREVGAITARVRGERDASTRGLADLNRLRGEQTRVTAQMQTVRDGLSGIQSELDQKQTALADARQLQADALAATQAHQDDLRHQLSSALAAQRARAAAARARALAAKLRALAAPPAVSSSPAGTSFTIPWSIVQCESGGQNLPPNSAGASGYYQIIPDTWKGYGGSTAQAYQASKAEQDAVAARIWDGGAGARNWVCAALVGIT